MRLALRSTTALLLAGLLLSGCIVVPVGRQPSQAYRPPQGGYTEPAYPAYPSQPQYGERYADVR